MFSPGITIMRPQKPIFLQLKELLIYTWTESNQSSIDCIFVVDSSPWLSEWRVMIWEFSDDREVGDNQPVKSLAAFYEFSVDKEVGGRESSLRSNQCEPEIFSFKYFPREDCVHLSACSHKESLIIVSPSKSCDCALKIFHLFMWKCCYSRATIYFYPNEF